MALVKCNKYIALCIGRNICVFDTENETHTLTTIPQIARKKQNNLEDNDETKNDDIGVIVLSATSKCNQLLAVATSGDKFLFIYEFKYASLELLSTYQLARAPSAINFTSDSEHLLVADKTGDCYIYECKPNVNDFDDDGKWILGHCSMVLDILMTDCSKFIITCDRDEKIRVTNYPRTEEIETYCLGHLEFVSAIQAISNGSTKMRLISVSGDKTLRLWDYVNGLELSRIDLPAPAFNLIRNNRNQLAVAMLGDRPLIGIYEIISLENDKPEQITNHMEYTLNGNLKHISSMIYKSDDCIWLMCYSDENALILKQLQLSEGEILETDLMDLINFDSTAKQYPQNDITILFKKKFDNIKDYQEKKKRRLGEKNSK